MAYCPIFTIGFAPPKKGERDARVCKKDCAWFDKDQEACAIVLIAESLQRTETSVNDVFDMMADINYEMPTYEEEI